MGAVIYVVPAVSVCLAAGIVLWYRQRTKRIMMKMDRMLEAAIQGEFTERDFDESMLSALEAKLADYLAASEVSVQNLSEERRKIKELVSDISHQTKTPIANVLLYAGLLAEQDIPEDSRELVRALEGQAGKLQVLIQELVKMSRLEAGILAMHPAVTSVGPMLETAVGQLLPKAQEKGIRLSMIPTEETAWFDEKWTGEAVCNLLDNAVKYSLPGGEVTVSVTAYEMFCRIDVKDCGPGILEEEHARIFGRFYRGKRHLTEDGLGIGLYLVRQIAAGQGGYVKVDSKEGQGATFSLFLPR